MPIGAATGGSSSLRLNWFLGKTGKRPRLRAHPSITSVFFRKSQPTHVFEDLGLAYMHDQDEDDYDELMGGEVTNAYTVRSEVWLPDGKDLARDFSFEKAERDEAHRWLESRLWARCR